MSTVPKFKYTKKGKQRLLELCAAGMTEMKARVEVAGTLTGKISIKIIEDSTNIVIKKIKIGNDCIAIVSTISNIYNEFN